MFRKIEVGGLKIEEGGLTSEFSLEFYNYFMLLDRQSIINYLFGLSCAKSLGEESKWRDEKKKSGLKKPKEGG